MYNILRFPLLRHSLLISSVALIVFAALVGIYAYSREPYITVDALAARSDITSTYGLVFNLRPNDVFGTKLVFRGGDVPIYLAPLEGATVSYSIRLSRGIFSGTYTIRVAVQHPDGWSKSLWEYNGNFSMASQVSKSLELNISEITYTMERLSGQIGIRLTTFDIVIASYSDYTVSLGAESRSESLEHSLTLTIDLIRNRVFVKGNTESSRTVEIRYTKTIPVYVLGLPLDLARTVTPIVGALGIGLLSVYIAIYMKEITEDVVARLEKKYRDIIVEGAKPPTLLGEVIEIKDLEELAKVARVLEKPIIKIPMESGGIEYFIVDKNTAYMVVIREIKT